MVIDHNTSDEILVELLKKDSERAFEMVYTRYYRKLFVFVYSRIDSKEEAEEIIHELFLSIWYNRSKSEIKNLKLYVYIAARNLVNRYLKIQIRLRNIKQEKLDYAATEVIDMDRLFNENRLNVMIEAVLMKVPVKTAQIFRMHKLEELSVKVIANEMGITEKAVEYHITKSLKMMRLYLKDYYSKN